VSKNLTFFILGLISAVLAYIFYPSLPAWTELVTTERLPREFTRMVQNSTIVSFAGFTSLFGLSFVLLYLIFPVSYVWYHLLSAQRIIAELPLISNMIKRTTKKGFLSQLKGLGFIERLAISYDPYLIQGPEEEVKAEVLKKIRIIKKSVGNDKNEKHTISPVRATTPAEMFFNMDSLVSDHLLLGFFIIFARVMIGAGVICLGILLVSYSFIEGKGQGTLLSSVLPGLTAFLYFLFSAVIITGLVHLVTLILSQNARRLARMINGLFHQNNWQQDINSIQEQLTSNSATEKFGAILHNSLDKPMKEISKAVKALTTEQEKKLDNILSETLVRFADNMGKKSEADIAHLSKTLNGAADAADQMKKQFTDSNLQFSKQMDKQTTAIAKHLTDMQKILTNSEKTTQKAAEKIVSSLAAEVEGTYGRLGKFMETSLSRLDSKHKTLESAVNDKNGILKDLHASAKDLGTISNASGMLLERFISLSTELDIILEHLQENSSDQNYGSSEKRDKLKLAMMKLQKTKKDKISELPDM